MKTLKLSRLVFLSLFAILIATACDSDNNAGKKKTITVNMTIDQDGTTTTIDTIIVDMDLDNVDHMVAEMEEALLESADELKELRVEVTAEMDEFKKEYSQELKESQQEVKEAIRVLQEELDKMELSDETKEKIEKAIEKLKAVDWNEHAQHFKTILIETNQDTDSQVVGEDVEIIIHGNDTVKVIKKVIKK